jgi:hypothetical protein
MTAQAKRVVTFRELLELAGFKFFGEGKHCICPQGHYKTTSVDHYKMLWYCKRCERGGNAYPLARRYNVRVAKPIRLIDARYQAVLTRRQQQYSDCPSACPIFYPWRLKYNDEKKSAYIKEMQKLGRCGT